MTEKPSIPAENPEKKKYVEKTLDDLCPAEKSKRKIKNCSCDDCKGFREQNAQKEPEHKESEQASKKLGLLLMNRRTALGAIIAGAALGGWMKLRGNETAPPPAVPEKIKRFPRTLEVEGMKIHLDVSWNNYPAPTGKTIEELFQGELKNIVPFYKTFGIDLKGKELTFLYTPEIKDFGMVQYTLKPYGVGNVQENEYDQEGRLVSMNMFMKDQTPRPVPIKLRFIRGATIAHEIFHLLHGPYFYATNLWSEGIAEGFEGLYKDQFPESEKIQTSDRSSAEKWERIEAFAKEFYDHPEVQKLLAEQGFDESWILQEENQFPTHSGNAPRGIAGVRWESFLRDHPDFLGRFLPKLDEVNALMQRQTTGDKDFVFQGNSRQLAAIGHLAAPEYFWNWMKAEQIFQRGRAGEKISFAFLHPGGKHLTVLSGEWENVKLQTTIYGPNNKSITIPRLMPRPFTIILKNGHELELSDEKNVLIEIEQSFNSEEIQSIRDFEDNEMRIIR